MALCFLFLYAPGFSQTVVFKNGRSVEGKPVVVYNHPKPATIELAGKQFPTDSILGFFKSKSEPMKYLVISSNPDAKRVEWDFKERSLEGVINLYSWTSNYPNATQTLIMAEKGPQYGFVFANNVDNQSQLEMVNRLRALMGDVPSLTPAIDSVASKWSPESVMAIVARYNLQKFKSISTSAKLLAPIVLLVKPTNQNYPFKVVVDDSLQYDLSLSKPLSLYLHNNQLRKVCVSTPGMNQCFLARSTSCCIQYYQVFPDRKTKRLDISRVEEGIAQHYIGRGQTR